MKKTYLVLAILFLFCTFGFGCKNSNKEKTEIIGESKISDDSFGGCKMNIEKLSKIKIQDVVANMYANELDVQLDNGLILEFKNIISNVIEKDDNFETSPWYAITFCDDCDQVLDRWVIDTHDTITNLDGERYFRTRKIDEWLKQIEKKNNITRNMLADKPGKNYFGLLENVCFGTILKNDSITEAYSSINANEINEGELSSLKNVLSSSLIDNLNKSKYSEIYTIVLYSETGSVLYTLHVDENNNIYTCYGYQIEAPDFLGVINDII